MGIFDFFKKKDSTEINANSNVSTSVNTQVVGTINNNSVSSNDFFMIVDDVFSISKGVIVTGTISSGIVSIGDTLIMVDTQVPAIVKGIEVFRKQIDYAKAGDKVGLLLDSVARDQIVVGGALHKA